ncbi:MAG: GlsB/YeaQ/YmgE family stress response membrane protein [Paracoccaceae bacterium]|nr:MAG: GlsB/YeaQ/YmgE family stress response membrane protein [Paracoccaceae bacterium]
MGPVSLVAILIVGGVAGWLAGRIVTGRGHGLLGNIVVGIAGAVIGGAVVPMLGLGLGVGLVRQVITATLGAVILLGIVKVVRKV